MFNYPTGDPFTQPRGGSAPCPHCGFLHTTTCPRIKAIEYENGMVKRIEFHPLGEARESKHTMTLHRYTDEELELIRAQLREGNDRAREVAKRRGIKLHPKIEAMRNANGEEPRR